MVHTASDWFEAASANLNLGAYSLWVRYAAAEVLEAPPQKGFRFGQEKKEIEWRNRIIDLVDTSIL